MSPQAKPQTAPTARRERAPRAPGAGPAAKPRRAARRGGRSARSQRLARRLAAWRRWLRWPRLSSLLRRLLAVVLGTAAITWSAGPVYAQGSLPIAAGALPAGGVVVTGTGSLAQHGGTLTVVQSSPRLGIDWQSFSIGRDALVEFLQPGPGSIALNRVVGHEATQIYGRLRANGQVFLTNPNGVLFAPGARVDVGGLVASALDMSQADFAAGLHRFTATPGATGGVRNEGELTAHAGGYLALFGPTVDNRGELRVDAGSVVLASGRAATVSISGSGLLSAVVDPGVAGSVLNSGRIAADGGSVTLTAASAEALASSLVNNTGIVRAHSIEERGGQIWITGDRVESSGRIEADARGAADAGRIDVIGDLAHGSLVLGGTLSARAEGGRGGLVETSAAQVNIAPETRVDTRSAAGRHGRWLIDPTDFTVSDGTAPSTTTGIGSATLSANLELGNVALATLASGTGNGDLFVNGPVTWNAATTLTLSAHRHVEVNREIHATGAGNLVIDVDTDNNGSGRFVLNSRVRLPGSGGFTLDNVGYTKLRSASELQGIALGGNYILAGDIALDGVANWNPIGNEASATFSAANAFTGRLDGLGHRLTGVLAVSNAAAQNNGLFAMLSGATVRNLEIERADIVGGLRAGALAGSANGATLIENVRVGTVDVPGGHAVSVQASNTTGGAWAGGLVGSVGSGSTVSLERVAVNPGAGSGALVTASATSFGAYAGGVTGQQMGGRIDGATVRVATITATAPGAGFAGGVVGDAQAGVVAATVTGGPIEGSAFAGGIVGRWTAPAGGEFRGNRAESDVRGAGHAGGLVGVAGGTGTLSDSDALGNVSSSAGDGAALYAGGAVGWYALSGAPSDITAAGNVVGGGMTGGLIGYLQSNVALGAGSLVSVVPAGSTRTIIGPRWVGGLIGFSDSTGALSGLSFSGSVTATGTSGATGGLVGRSNGAVTSSSSSGTVTSAGTAGGLVGQANGSGGFDTVSSSASVSTTGSSTGLRTGGLVGWYNHDGNLVRGTATGAVSGSGAVGGLVGLAQTTSGSFGITDSTASGNVTLSGLGSSYGGGLVGQYNMSGAMRRVQAAGTVGGADAAGGLVGFFQSSALLDEASQTGATVSGITWVGGLVGYANDGTLSRVSAVAAVSTAADGTRYVGGLAGRTAGSIDIATATGPVSATASSGTHYVGGLVGRAEGSGRTISAATASGNVNIASSSNSGASGGLVGWASHGSITDSSASGAVSGGLYAGGIVGYFNPSSGNLSGLTASGHVSSRGDAGGLVGFAQGTGALTGSTASGNVSSTDTSGYSVGGAVGYTTMSGGVSGVSAAGSVNGGWYTGGVVGYHNTTGALASVSTTTPTVTGTTWVGGLVGYSRAAAIDGLTANANVVQAGTGGAAGGLAGYHSGAIANSSATGAVSGRNHVGGLVGQAEGSGAKATLTASGNVSSTSGSANVGGLIGQLGGGNLTDASATGTVSGGGQTGGLVGWYSATATASGLRASGNVSTSAGGSAGGLIGYADGNGSISDARASGSVTASGSASQVGGLIGYFGKPGGLSDAHATGAVSGGTRTGGLVGYYVNGGNLAGASATGDVIGSTYVGGLVGDFVSSGSLSNATATGRVQGNYAGGLVGSFFSSGDSLNLQASGAVTGGTYGGGLYGLWQYSGILKDSATTGAVTADNYAGGLVGYGYDNDGIDNSRASGNISSAGRAGGLAGDLTLTNISRGTASGRVLVAGPSFSTGYAGGLVGTFFTNAPGGGIFDSRASGAVLADTYYGYSGGLVGYTTGGSIERSSATGAVLGDDTSGTISGSHRAGGLVGYLSLAASSRFIDNTASGAVTADGQAGGLIGQAHGSAASSGALTNSSASGRVTGSSDAGGLVGLLEYIGIVNGTATGAVVNTGTSGGAGGLVGSQQAYYASSSIVDSRASGDVSGGQFAGGLVGSRTGFGGVAAGSTGIRDSSASGNVSGARMAGGLVGNYDGSHGRGGLVGQFSGYGGFDGGVAAGGISDSLATGAVTLAYGNATSNAAVGGLVGRHVAITRTSPAGTQLGGVVRSAALGPVTLAATTAIASTRDIHGGGLVGWMDGPTAAAVTVADSYATGAVSLLDAGGRLSAGGLVGWTDGSLLNSYATGRVEATGLPASRAVGGLVGRPAASGATAVASFWATDSTGQSTSPLGTASTLADLRSAARFSGWSLATAGGSSATWRLYEGQTTPLLRNLLSPLTVGLADVSKVYDGTASLGSVPLTIGGASVLEPQNLFIAGTAVDAGSYAFGAANVYSNQLGYDLTVSGSATLTITRRPLTLDGLVADKVYDGGTAATVLGSPVLGGLVAGEDLVFNAGAGFSAAFASKAAGPDRTVNLTGSFSLADGSVGKASNYLLPSSPTTTADILPRPVSVGGLAAVSRPYDGTTAVQLTASGSVTGVLDGDLVSFDPATVTAGTIPSRNVGTQPVTVSGVLLGGPDGGNYRVIGADTLTVAITPRPLVLNGLTADDRNYNASTAITVRGDSATLTGVVAGDNVQPATDRLRGSMADKNVGDDKPVTVTGAGLRGFDAGNYSVTPGPVSVNITPRPLTIQLWHTGSASRVYDGTTSASVFFPTTWIGGDAITVTAAATGYADKNVAYTAGGVVTSKPISATGIAIGGADAANYALQNTTATVNGTITPKPLTVSGVTAVNRVYDGTRDVTVAIAGATVDTSAVIPGDEVSVSTPAGGSVVGQMADKNVGTAKPVTVPGLALTGNDALNYSITGSGSGVTVDITRKPVTATYTALDREYNGGTAAGVRVTTPDFVAGDAVNFYIDVSNCGLLSCGYAQFVTPGSTLASYTLDRHVGTDKPVLVVSSNFIIGSDAGNYTLTNPRGEATSARVTPRPVTLSFSGVERVYDGTTGATVTLNRGGSSVFSVDDVSTTQTAVFTGAGAKNVGNSKPIAVSDIVLSGPDAGNYTVTNTTASTTGRVTPKPVTVSGITATDRAYDGSTTVAVIAGTVGSSGFVDGDIVSVSLPPAGLSTGTIATPGVGTDKPVTVTGLTLTGSDAINYLIDSATSGITVDILPRALVPTYTAPDKVYDGGITAAVTSTTAGIVSGDAVTLVQTARFVGDGARNVGSGKPIAVTDIRLSGSGAANYTLASTTASTTGNIVPKSVTVSYVGGSRVYNGLADLTAPVVGSSLQFVAGDLIGVSQTALFTTDGAAGSGKPVSISGVALTGADAANYTLGGFSGSVTATVTPRPLSVTGVTATSRVYDGSTTVAVNVSGARVDTSAVIPGDRVGIALPPDGISTGTLADRFAGNAKPVTISGASLSGEESANYVLVGATGLTVNIAPRPLTASYAALDKVYDGSADAGVLATPADLLPVDAGGVGVSATGVFSAGKGAGTDKAVAVSGGFLTGAWAGNYTLVNPSGTSSADITPRTLSLGFSGITKVYDGLTAVSVSATLGGRVAGDVVSSTASAEFTGDGARNVGTDKPVAISGITLTGADAANYRLETDTATARGSITPRPITISGLDAVTAVDRVYDGTRDVTVVVPAGVTLTPVSGDILAGDSVSIALPGSGLTSGTMADRHVGEGKPVTITGLTLAGLDAANYRIAGTAGVTVDISPLALTASWAGVNRIYDGSTAAQASGSATGIVAGDSVLIRGSGFFSDGRNVGTAKPISITSALLSGSEARNYTLLNPTGSASADVTPRTVTPGYGSVTKVYDGSVEAPVVPAFGGLIAGDAVRATQTAVFTGAGARNAGTGKTVAVSGIALSGADAGNYVLASTTATTSGSITPRPLTLTGLTGVTADDRVYDGSTAVSVRISGSGPVAVDPAAVVPGDEVSVNPLVGDRTTGTMADKHVGTLKPVVVDGLALTGADAANYRVAATEGVTVNITPRALTAVYTGVDKVYDGSAAAQVLGSSADILGGDTVLIGGAAFFTAGRNAGTGLAVEVTAGLLTGADARNYRLTNPSGSTTADILPRLVSAAFTGGSRVYDGGVSAPVLGSLAGLVEGDAVTLTQSAVFTGPGARNAGTAKPVAVSGIGLSGTDAGNYRLAADTATTTATVTPRPLRIVGLTGVSATDRVYDGTREVQVTVSTSGPIAPEPGDLIAGDEVTLTAPPAGTTTGLMADKHVGTAKPVAVTGLSIGGADAANYSVAETTGVTVTISPRALTPSFVGISRVYDGGTAASVGGLSADVLAGDSVLILGSGVFTGDGARNAGLNKPVAVTAATLGGADGRNYQLTTTTGSTTADITPRLLGLAYTGVAREYDGSVNALVTRSLSNLVAGDSVGISETARFTDGRNVGIDKPVLVSGITLTGADAGNYLLGAATATTTASVTPRLLTVTGLSGLSVTDRVYDGTLDVAVSFGAGGGGATGASNVVPGDDVVVAFSGAGGAQMLDKHAGLAKPVALTGLTLSGADAGNYRVGGVDGLTVNIAPRPVSLAGVRALDRVYDGSTLVAIDRSGARIEGAIAGDELELATDATGTLPDKAAGDNRPVSVAGIALAGADARNYVVGDSAAITANIAPRVISAVFAGLDKVYDGSTAASVAISAAGLLAGDAATLLGNAVFTGPGARNAGTDKPVAISDLRLSGADAGNYRLTASAGTTTASILPRTLSAGVTVAPRVYDGTTTASVSLVSSGVVDGDAVTLAGTATYTGEGARNAGLDKPVTVAGLTLGGADAGNYTLAGITSLVTTGSITPRPLVLSMTVLDKVYDGDTGARLLITTDRLAGDDLVVTASGAAFERADAGSGLRVDIGALALAGADRGNYSLPASLPALSGDILRAPLLITAGAIDKLYGTVGVPLGTEFSATGLVGSQSVGSVTLASAGFGALQPVAGSPYALVPSAATGGSFNPANYDITYRDGTVTVRPRPVTISSDFVVAFENELAGLGFAASVSGLLPGLGHTVTGLVPPAPALSGALGGSRISLLHSGGRVSGTEPGNYELRYEAGQLIVLPRPVQLSDQPDAGDGDGGFGIGSFTPEEIAAAGAALQETLRMLNAPAAGDGLAGPGLQLPGVPGTLTAAELAALFGSDARQITLPALQRLPLISLDPGLRRLLGAAPTP